MPPSIAKMWADPRHFLMDGRKRPRDDDRDGADVRGFERLPLLLEPVRAADARSIQIRVLRIVFGPDARIDEARCAFRSRDSLVIPVCRCLTWGGVCDADLGDRPELPGPLAIALTRTSLGEALGLARFNVCEKSDGERHMLLATQSPPCVTLPVAIRLHTPAVTRMLVLTTQRRISA